MNEMKEISKLAYNWLFYDSNESLENWKRHKFDEHVKNNHVTNNMTEPFKRQFLDCWNGLKEKL